MRGPGTALEGPDYVVRDPPAIEGPFVARDVFAVHEAVKKLRVEPKVVSDRSERRGGRRVGPGCVIGSGVLRHDVEVRRLALPLAEGATGGGLEQVEPDIRRIEVVRRRLARLEHAVGAAALRDGDAGERHDEVPRCRFEPRRARVVPHRLLARARFDALDRHEASMVAVGPHANPLDDPADAAAMVVHAHALIAAVDAALPRWAERVVRERWREWAGTEPSPELKAAAAAAGERAQAEIMPALRRLLEADVEAQRSNPLALVRAAVAHPTGVLADAGVPDVVRDADVQRLFPEDRYGLSPASFRDLDPSVHEPGLAWGAAKAHLILTRRRRSGTR